MDLPHFIILSGVCATGKTTIGQTLAEQLNYDFMDGDDYHSKLCVEKMSKGVGLNDEDRREWLEQLSHFGDQPNKHVVLACSALKRAYRRVLAGDRTDTQCQIFLLTAKRNVLEERLATRKNHYAKTSLLDSQFETLELKQNDENNVHEVDVSGGSVQQVVDEIIARLKRH